MDVLLDFFRVLTILMSAVGIGMALTIARIYKKHSRTGALLPIHVALIGLSWSILAAESIYVSIVNIHEGLTVNLALTFPGALLGVMALYVLLQHIRTRRNIDRLDIHRDTVLDARVSSLIERAQE
jgi:hypothetical protein